MGVVIGVFDGLDFVYRGNLMMGQKYHTIRDIRYTVSRKRGILGWGNEEGVDKRLIKENKERKMVDANFCLRVFD